MKRILLITVAATLALLLTFFLGPKPHFEDIDLSYQDWTYGIEELDSIISEKEAKISLLKPGNEAQVVWLDSTKAKTAISIVYLHGFSASWMEGNPIHKEIAKRYGCNLFLSRLADHGRSDSNTFKDITPAQLLESAKWAIQVGKTIGEKVIVMSCSTGSTYAAILSGGDSEIVANIMYSPNIDLFDSNASLVTGHWGHQISRIAFGGEYYYVTYDSEPAKYWNEVYHTDGIVAMKSMIDKYMNRVTFEKLNQPLFLGYYYKDERNQDQVVSVPRMHDFFNQISTPIEQKRMVAFPDAGRHVIASSVMSKDMVNVKKETIKFIEEVLKLKPKLTDTLMSEI